MPAALVVWEVVAYSMLGHKEFRFLFPILPLMHAYCGVVLAHLETMADHRRALGLVLFGILVVNIPMAAYFSVMHQQGTLSVMTYLRDEYVRKVRLLYVRSFEK